MCINCVNKGREVFTLEHFGVDYYNTVMLDHI